YPLEEFEAPRRADGLSSATLGKDHENTRLRSHRDLTCSCIRWDHVVARSRGRVLRARDLVFPPFTSRLAVANLQSAQRSRHALPSCQRDAVVGDMGFFARSDDVPSRARHLSSRLEAGRRSAAGCTTAALLPRL